MVSSELPASFFFKAYMKTLLPGSCMESWDLL